MENNNHFSQRHQAIEKYIQKVTELTQVGNHIISDEELLQFASELGISDEEIAIVQQQSQAHYIRGQGYYNLAHWDEAIVELEDALAINPFNLSMLHLLTKSYISRWQKHHKYRDEQQIRIRIKQCLEIQPDDQESLKLLAQFDKLKHSFKYQKWGLSGVILITVGLLIGIFFPPNISLSSLLMKENRLEQVNKDLINQIETLRKEQEFLYNQLYEENRLQKQVNEELNFYIQDLENKLETLTIKQQNLIEKLNNSSSPPAILNNLPSDNQNQE